MNGNTVISIFAGCGGSSLGYKWAGFKELLAIDFDNNAVETFKLNFPGVPVWNRDITTVKANEILEFCNIRVGELGILDGSPPCQGFSTAGKRQVTDNRNDLFKSFVYLIQELQPKIFIMENVSGMVKGKMKGKFKEIILSLKALNYQVKCKLLNAKYYEVPQSRQRLFFIGIRNDLNLQPVFPEPLGKTITFGEATKGIIDYIDRELPEVLKVIAKYQPVDSWSSIPSIYKKYKGNLASSFSLKWASNKNVLGTIPKSEISLTGIIHPNRKRYLNLDELKVCASFPSDFKFTDRKNGAMRVGNSVMPKQMYHIAKTLKEKVLNDNTGNQAKACKTKIA